MKILMLTPYLPYPLWSGGQIRTYNLLKHLSKKHDITLFSFIRSNQEHQYVEHLGKFCSEVKVFLKRPPWSLKSLTLSALTFYPLVVCMYLNNKVQEAIATSIEVNRFDLIHAETFYVLPNIPQNDIPVILVEQTIEYLVYRHYTKNMNFLPFKILMNWDVAKIRYWEKRFWQKATRVVAMSSSDKKIMQEYVPSLNVDIVPNGVDCHYFHEKNQKITKKRRNVLFVGNFKWLQNREAASILLNFIWPKIHTQLKDARLWIVGKHSPEEVKKRASQSIIVTDSIDDIRQVYKEADVLLAPIYGPGGTRYKILEAMATGVPVVTTTTGIEGLASKNNIHAKVFDTPEELAEGTIQLLQNKKLYRKLALNGRELVEKHFSWSLIAGKLDSIYQEAVRCYGQKG